MEIILYILSIILFSSSIFLILLNIFKVKSIKNELLINRHLSKLKSESSFSKIKNKITKYIASKIKDSSPFIIKFNQNMSLALVKGDGKEYLISNIIYPIIFSLLSLIFIPISIYIPVAIIGISIILYFKKIKDVYSKASIRKEKINDELSNFVRFVIRQKDKTNDILAIISSYIVSSPPSPLTREMTILVSQMKTGPYSLALSTFDKKISSPLLSDVIRGLERMYYGEDMNAYFSMLDIKLDDYMKEKIEKTFSSYPKYIKLNSIISLILFIGTYICLMFDLISSSVSLAFL